jgi:hypothetical protein
VWYLTPPPPPPPPEVPPPPPDPTTRTSAVFGNEEGSFDKAVTVNAPDAVKTCAL